MYQNELPDPPSTACIGTQPSNATDLLDNLPTKEGIGWGVGVGMVLMLAMIAITLQQLTNKVIGQRLEYEDRLDAKIDAIIDRVDKIVEQIDYSS